MGTEAVNSGQAAGRRAGSGLCSDQLCIKGHRGACVATIWEHLCAQHPPPLCPAPCSPAAPPGKDSGSVHATVKQLWVAGDTAMR